MEIVIRDNPHEMLFEGSNDTVPKNKDIEKEVMNEGFLPYDYDVFFDKLQGFYRFKGKIRRITPAST